MARHAGTGLDGLYRLAYRHPLAWLQLAWDVQALAEQAEAQGRPGWLRRGERAVDARDRLRAEREAAKRRLGVS